MDNIREVIEVALPDPVHGEFISVENRGITGADRLVDGIWTVKPGGILHVIATPLFDADGEQVSTVWVKSLSWSELDRIERERQAGGP